MIAWDKNRDYYEQRKEKSTKIEENRIRFMLWGAGRSLLAGVRAAAVRLFDKRVPGNCAKGG